MKSHELKKLSDDIKAWGQALGFQQVGITNTDLSSYEHRFQEWLAKDYHGDMDYLARNETKRTHPTELVPDTKTIITVRMNYLPPHTQTVKTLLDKNKGYISRYALGQDYHKIIRKNLEKLAQKITAVVGPFGYRAFADSAPVLEKPLAEKSGLGWIGKNTLLLNREAGSWFFLGELYTDLPLPIDEPTPTSSPDSCGNCTACINICPTRAIVAPYVLDARRCISYLTIEFRGSIPIELRPLIGNRIYGCDDCQLICPWNRYAQPTKEPRFLPRHGLSDPQLLTLFAWTETEFLNYTAGSPLRRIGHEMWLRNIAIALGNAPADERIIAALDARLSDVSPLVQEHIQWALAEQTPPRDQTSMNSLENKLKRVNKLNDHY